MEKEGMKHSMLCKSRKMKDGTFYDGSMNLKDMDENCDCSFPLPQGPAKDGNGGMKERFEKWLEFNNVVKTVDISSKHVEVIKIFIASEIRLAEERLAGRIIEKASYRQVTSITHGAGDNYNIKCASVESIFSIMKGEGK